MRTGTLLERARWALEDCADLLKPWGVILTWTDCDGMRGTSTYLHWSKAAAVAEIEEFAYHAEGPSFGELVTGRQLRKFAANFEPDTRDRFAEAEGY